MKDYLKALVSLIFYYYLSKTFGYLEIVCRKQVKIFLRVIKKFMNILPAKGNPFNTELKMRSCLDNVNEIKPLDNLN